MIFMPTIRPLSNWSNGCAHSAEFAKWWNAHDIRGGASGRKMLIHPERGAQRYDYATFQANDDPGLKLAIYTPA